MKRQNKTSFNRLFGPFARSMQLKLSTAILMLAGSVLMSQAQSTWNGTNSTDWNDPLNWSAGVPSGATALINTNSPNICTITADLSATPVDIQVGNGGNTGRLDQIAGKAFTGPGNWFWLGYQDSHATYNLADTTTTGGAFTGYGEGSGSLYVGGTANPTGFLLVGLDTGTVSTMNVNTTGSVWCGFLSVGGNGTNTCTLNVDNGTIMVTNGDCRIGGDQFAQGYGTNRLNMSGGSITANIIAFARGDNASANMVGIGNLTGGTLNSKYWFTVGFNGVTNSLGAVTNNGATINAVIVGPGGGSGNFEMSTFDACSSYFKQVSGNVNLCNNSSLSFGAGSAGQSGTATFDQDGGFVTFYSDVHTNVGGTGLLLLGSGNDTGTYTYNLNGGTLTVPQITNSAGTLDTATFNFNGGTLKPTASNPVFLQGLTAVNVQSGGAKIDTAGYNITIGQYLQEDALSTGGGLTKTGNGTLTLGAGYGYTGATTVSGGTLSINPVLGTPGSPGDVVVSNATLQVACNSFYMPANNLTLDNNSVLNANFGSVSSLPYYPAVSASGSLTKGTNITINISMSGAGVVPGLVPLITVGSGSISTNQFVIGSLPAGVQGYLTNDTTTLYFDITVAVKNLSWFGVSADYSTLMTNWDVNDASNTNWVDASFNHLSYSEYAGPIGDSVEFGANGYSTTGTNQVNVTTTVVPATVTFDTSTPYTLTGVGGIGGSTAVTFTNSANVLMETTNSYTGGTQIGGNSALTINNDSALGATSSGVQLDGTLNFNDNISVSGSRSVTVTGASKVGANAGVSASLSGVISGNALSKLTKVNAGTVTLSGNNTYGGGTAVSQGTLNVSGAITNKIVSVGNGTVQNGILGISGNLSANYMFVGDAPAGGAGVGAVYQTGGNVIADGGGGDNLCIGNLSGSYGYYNAAGGTLTANGMAVGGENNLASGGNPNFGTAGGNGQMDINGATVNDTGWFVMTRNSGTELGVLNLFNGSLSFAGGGLVCNWFANQTAIINVMGGTLLTTNLGIGLGSAGTNNVGMLNLNGGTVAVTDIGGNFGGTAGEVNFDGGTLQAIANSSSMLRLNEAYVRSGGAVINDGGYSVSIGQPLLAPTGYGVSSVSLSDGGSGYIAPPIVTVAGGVGSNATVVAQIDVSSGTITNILVTSPGNGYDVTDGGTMTLNFIGGGATAVAPASATITLAANTSGGLTKNGSGTLTLGGANTYTGTTLVNSGTLTMTPAQKTATPVVVADGAQFSVASSSPANTGAVIGNLTLGNTTGAALGITCNYSGNPTNVVLTAGTVTVNGSSTLDVGGVFDVGVFPVLKYTSLSSLPTLVPPRGVTATLTNDTVNKILYVKVTAISPGIVWDGTIGLLTNVWDINITTNWYTGVTPTTYQQATIPGDAVVFNDSGSPTVLLSNSVSPANMIVSNAVENYTFSGSGGQINSTKGLNKVGAGQLTLNVPGNFSGNTVLSNGIVTVSAAQSFVNLQGDSTLNSSGTINVSNNVNTVYSGKIQSTADFFKAGSGAITFSTNVATHVFQVTSGKITLASSNSAGWDMPFGNGTGNTGEVDIVSGGSIRNTGGNYTMVGCNNGSAVLNVTGNGSVDAGTFWVGGSSFYDDGIGTANIDTTGTVGGRNGIRVGEAWNGGYGHGTVNLTNGTVLSGADFIVGSFCNTGSTNFGVFNQYGGTVASSDYFLMAREGNGGYSSGTYNLYNGQVFAATNTHFTSIGGYAPADGYLNVMGGTFNSPGGILVGEGWGGSAGATANGTLTVSGTGVVNTGNAATNGITLAASTAGYGNGVVNLNGGSINTASVSKGGGISAVWNFNGGTLAANGSSTNFMSGLDAANVLAGGAVIDTAGQTINIPQPLINNGTNQDGGLTKNGAGALKLDGINTYTNVTTVNAGTLGGSGTIAGAVVVNSGAGLAPGDATTLTINGNITLNSGSTNVFAVDGSTPANDQVVAGGSVTYGGVLSIVPTGTFTNGESFVLFSGAGAASASQFTSIVGSPGTGLGFTFTNGVLSVVNASVGPSGPEPLTNSYDASTHTLTLTWTPGENWRLEGQTNSLSSGLTTNGWFTVPGGVDGSNSITINPNNPTVFYRLVYP